MGSVRHFTENSGAGGTYDNEQQDAVTEYLRTGYPTGDTECEICVDGKKYKILKRASVTAFYDENGSTLFDVTNSRLTKEYGELIETTATPKTVMGKAIASIERQAFDAAVQEPEYMPTGGDTEGETDVIPMGTASLADIVTGRIPNPTEEEIAAAKKSLESVEMPNIAEQAVKKLNEELKKLSGTEKTFAELCVEYLIKRCGESQSLAEDICQTHKTWRQCYKYIYDKAKKYLGGTSGPVLDATVFEWAEDYYHLDDKAEEKRKPVEEVGRKKKEAESQKKAVRGTKPSKAKNEKISGKVKEQESTKMQPPEKKTPDAPMREVVKQNKPRKKAKKGELEGQMDLFSMMGL